MKNFKLIAFALLLAGLFCNFRVSAQEKKLDIVVESLGSLSGMISDSDKWSVTELSVSGWLNGDDLVVLREMTGADLYGNPTEGKLSVLDMSGARIAGYDESDPLKRKPYYMDESQGLMYLVRSDDWFSGNIFTGCSSLKEIVLPDQTVFFGGLMGADNVAVVRTTENSVNLKVEDNIVFSKDGKTLCYCPPKNLAVVDYTVPSGVEKIADGAFGYCESLKSIDIADSVKEIGSDAFSYSSLETVRIGAGLEKIAGYEDGENPDFAPDAPHPFYFAPIAVLTVAEANRSFKAEDNVLYSKDGTILYYAARKKPGDFTVPETVGTIAGYAFSLSELRSVVLPEGLQRFDRPFVFNQCVNLESVTVGAATETIDNKVFFYCPALKQVNVSEANLSYKSVEGVVYKKDELSTLSYLPGALSEYSVPEGTRALEAGALGYYNDKLEQLTLPSTMGQMGAPIGYYMMSLSTVCCKAKNPPALSTESGILWVSYRPESCVLYVPTGSLAAYEKEDGYIWRRTFTQIQEMDFSGVGVVAEAGGFEVKDVAGGIMICGYTGAVEVYTVDGRLAAACSADGETVVPLRRGIYLVRAGSETEKVFVSR